MGIWDKIKDTGHNFKEKAKNYNADRVIKNVEKKHVRQICAMWKLKQLKELCAYAGKFPPKSKTIIEEYGKPDPQNFDQRKTRMKKILIPQTHDYFVGWIPDNFSKKTVVDFSEQRGLRIPRELKEDVVSFQMSLEKKFQNCTMNDFEEVISRMGWDRKDFDSIEVLKKRLWKQVHDRNITEKEILQLLGNNLQNSNYSKKFEDMIDLIESEFHVKQFSREDDVQSQLEVFINAKFPDVFVDRRHIFKNRYGTKGEIELLIDDKFGIEVKVPSSSTDLRNMKSQLEQEQECVTNEILAVIIDADLIQGNAIDVTVKDFEDDLGVRTIVKKGHKKGVK